MILNNLFIILCIFILIGCSPIKQDYIDVKQSPTDKIVQQYKIDFISFENELLQLNQISESKTLTLESIQNQLVVTRLAYKKIEFIFDYFEPEYVYLYVNGGPLNKLHKEVSEVDLIPPNGLQRLDELIFIDDLNESISEIKDKTKDLSEAITFIKESHFNNTITPQNSFEFLRSGIVRLFTLGLTGFDTPGSGNSIAESSGSLSAMLKAFSFYSENLNLEQKEIFQNLIVAYKRGLTQLESAVDFDSFDRMKFLKTVFNPIYNDLYTLQKTIGVDTNSLHIHAQNYHVASLFDENFLDRDFYTQYSYNDTKNKDAIELGKTLFYDPILSRNLDMSCSSCHNPKQGFTDGLAKSPTNQRNVFAKRNSPTLIDVAYSTKYFWDMREHDLEKQVAHVVEDSLEFNIGFNKIEKRLYQSQQYINMFEAAYGDISKKDISQRSISNAIASYVNTLTSFNSPFDQYARNESDNYTESAIAGFNLFMGKAACGTCHFAPVFNGSVPPFYTDAESEVLGVTLGYNPEDPILDSDLGRSHNGRSSDAHPHFDRSIKTVTVRNIALTAPYMHNGLFETLEDVIDFYNDAGGAGMGLDINNQTLSSDSLNLNEIEKSQLIDFLHSLTDTTCLQPGTIDLPTFKNQRYWNQRGRPKIVDD
ncbi:MAG: cytochrome c peroxidase [Saprospiraceae bacterium]